MNGTYRIVVGVDGSDGGRRALRWALRDAARRSGTVQAVIAWTCHDDDHAGARERAIEVLGREVSAAIHEFDPAPQVAWEAVEGRPPRVLTHADRDADLLVLGSHGHGRAHHAALGSVTEETVRYAACPVVVVPEPHPEWEVLPEEPALPTPPAG
jgi:nucleotide-binding universal stress UspA family protein